MALIGKNVVWYNDIEEGFNFSKFTNYGEIDNYNCCQAELYECIEDLYVELTGVKD